MFHTKVVSLSSSPVVVPNPLFSMPLFVPVPLASHGKKSKNTNYLFTDPPPVVRRQSAACCHHPTQTAARPPFINVVITPTQLHNRAQWRLYKERKKRENHVSTCDYLRQQRWLCRWRRWPGGGKRQVRDGRGRRRGGTFTHLWTLMQVSTRTKVIGGGPQGSDGWWGGIAGTQAVGERASVPPHKNTSEEGSILQKKKNLLYNN